MPKRTDLFSRTAGAVLAIAAIGSGISATPAQSQQAPAQQAVPVGTVVAEKKPVSRASDFVGRVEAINRVQVRARVTGYLEKILFKEGDTIKEGAPVYQIEKGQFEAAVKQAEGALERAKAAKVLTAVQLKRAEDLLARASGTEVTRDQALAADQQAAAAILEAEAQLQTAQINLGYTDITSPIAGKIGRTAITVGNVVGPDSGPLTTIVSQDPMYVTFPVSQRDFLRAQQSGTRPDLRALTVRLRYADGSEYSETGTLNFVDVSVDRGTDTVTVRATVPNPNYGLIDGQLMRVVVEAAKPEEKIVIPQAALIADQEGVYIFVVQDGKAAVRRVVPGAGHGTGVVIESGLQGGELVIVQGLQSIRPGAPVRAVPVARTPDQG
jgi:membrane fusion protein (multidrug efflux system)